MSPAFSLAVFLLAVPVLSAQEKVKPPKPDAAKAKRPALLDDDGRVVGAPKLGGGAGGKFGGRRNGRKRLGKVIPSIAKTIADGLKWIRRHQDADGGFDAAGFMRHDKTGKKSDGPGEGVGRVGITGFCLLPFLGDGSTLGSGPFRDVVRRGIEFLRTQQAESGAYSKRLLEHAVATYAVCEAAGLSQSEVLSVEARKALEYLALLQNSDGGFSYRGKGKPSDAYTTLQAMLAFRSGVDFRLTRNTTVMKSLHDWVDRPMEKTATPAPIAHGARSKESVLAAKLLVSFFLGRSPRKFFSMSDFADSLLEHRPTDQKNAVDPVFHYLATYGLYQMGAPYWNQWAGPMNDLLVGSQRDDGNAAGSWDPMGPGAVLGGRLYVTALSVLTAETYYRYTRLTR